MQTDRAEEPGIKARLGYSVSLPARCCLNCACSCFPWSSACSRIAAEFSLPAMRRFAGDGLAGDDPAVSECGVCSKWISKAVAKIYRSSASFEEARLRASVVSDGSYTDELDNAFCEKKATPRMLEYMNTILGEPGLAGRLTPVPFDAVLSGEPGFTLLNVEYSDEAPLQFGLSGSFWLVHEWLKANSPVYEEFMERRRRVAGWKTFKNFMIRMDIDPSGSAV